MLSDYSSWFWVRRRDGSFGECKFLKKPTPSIHPPAGLIIVKAIRNYQENNQHVFPIILTADTNMAELCIAKGPECFHFTYPSSVEVDTCTPYQLRDLIFYLARVCGLIKCNSVIIYPHLGLSPANDQSDYLRLLSCQNFPKYCLNHKGRIYLQIFSLFHILDLSDQDKLQQL